MPSRLRCAALLAVLVCAPLAPVRAQSSPPSPADVLGWELGERFSDVADVNRYMTALAEASPRVSVERYGESWEGRPLIQVLVASEAHRARLDEILAANRELADPDTPPERAEAIVRANPGVAYLSYGVHGNESSSSEAAMWTAWDLAREAPEVAGVLDSLVVVIDPVLNPDGRDRYVGWYRGVRGAEPNPHPEAREHSEPWPGGRTNHYYFDLNRDWTWVSQAETRARLATWDRWMPQVHVDFHEMSWRSSYFFFPAAEPINPIYPPSILEWGRRFGEGNAAEFDREGWLYYTGESYDHFYPGYGDTWPALLGAIGMTYEQAGGGFAGLSIERPDGTLLTLRDRATHHRATGRATLRTAAEGRTRLLEDFAAFHRSVAEGLPDILIVPGEQPGRADALVALLRDQGIAVHASGEAFGANARAHPGWEARDRFPAGTYRVPARQARGRLAVTLLQPETLLDATFSYDISAWSLPYGFGVEAHSVTAAPDAGWSAVETAPGGAPDAELGRAAAAYGYLILPGFDAWPGVVRYLAAGGRVRVLADSFRIGEDPYPRGTFFLPRGVDPALDERVRAAGLEGLVRGAATGFTDEGPDLGTDEAGDLMLPRVALITGEGTSSGSAGAHLFFLERRLGLPFDAIDVDGLEDLDLDLYDVIVMPSTSGLTARVGEEVTGALVAWARAGGTLVAVAGGAEEVAGWVDIELREAVEPEESAVIERALRTREERELERWERQTPGTVLAVRLDPGHPVAFGAGIDGAPSRMYVLSTGSNFEPDEGFETVASFPDAVERVSGVIGEATLDRLRRSSWLIQRRMGEGSVILFADDPLYRMMWYSGFQPYTNALLLAPAF
jgi:hypothetical protein